MANPAAATPGDETPAPVTVPNGIPTLGPEPHESPAPESPAPEPAPAPDPEPEPAEPPEGVPPVDEVLPAEPMTPTPPPLTPAAPSLPVWVFGDSIAYGTWLADPGTQSWPAQVDERMGPGQQVRNLGIGGQAVAFGQPDVPRMDSYVRETLLATPADQLPATIVLAGGVNDLIRSDNSMWDTRLAVFNLVLWIGYTYPQVEVVVATLTPMLAVHPWWAPTLSFRRDVYNTWARAQWGPSGQLLDVGDLLTAGSTYADVRYYVDSLHPDVEGAAVLAHGAFDVLSQRGAA